MFDVRTVVAAAALAGGVLGWPAAMDSSGPERHTEATTSAVSDAADVASVLMAGIRATGIG